MAYPTDASLINIGQTQLGKSGNVKLSELNTTHAETRVYGTYGYKRVNNNEEATDDCPAQGDAQSTSAGTGAANSLAKWIGYAQWETGAHPGTSEYPNQGLNFNLTAKDAGASATDGTAAFSWSLPAGYAGFPSTLVTQELWVRPCTAAAPAQDDATDCEDDSPFVAAPVSRRYALTDGTTAAANLLTENTWYVAGVRMAWNDENDSGGTYTQTGAGYQIHGTLAYGGTDYGDEQAIVFQSDDFIPCTSIDVGLSDTTSTVGACNACSNWNSGAGTRTDVKINAAAFSTSKHLHDQSGTCVVGDRLSHEQKWVSNNGEVAYTLSSGFVTTTSYSCQNNPDGHSECEA